ncbi:MAG TPA: cbb3-type cytochrome c oxidase subunit I, partial [Segetibacter sp.]
ITRSHRYVCKSGCCINSADLAYHIPLSTLATVCIKPTGSTLNVVINPPIALYYMQGLNTTPVHGHTALFGVYGMLGIGLMLFVLKGLYSQFVWKDGIIKVAFWSINIGLLLMVTISVLPVGFMQTVASVERGMWYARSAEFMQQPLLQTFRWLRVIGDTIFAVGALALAIFVIGLKTGWSVDRTEIDVSEENYPTARKKEATTA